MTIENSPTNERTSIPTKCVPPTVNHLPLPPPLYSLGAIRMLDPEEYCGRKEDDIGWSNCDHNEQGQGRKSTWQGRLFHTDTYFHLST